MALFVMPISFSRFELALLLCLVSLTACGGGSSSSDAPATSTTPPPAGSSPTPPPIDGSAGPTDLQRTQAATATAEDDSNACSSIRPFYWEIGNSTAAIASGSVKSTTVATVYTANSLMGIASSSKWLYAAYVAQKKGGALSADDVKFLNFRSGYTNFDQCDQSATVGECDAAGTNGLYTAANDGKFYYNGGHMEKHATLMGLSPLNNASLAAEIKSQIGTDLSVNYSQPQLAGGIYTTPANYAGALRKMLSGELTMGGMLGSYAVCTNPKTCPDAKSAPIPSSESWHYSIGHWVEDDPVVGDGAFSSAGLFGFYPWIDASKTYYGVLGRQTSGGALDSVYCGRLIRKAWATGISQ